MKSKKLAIAILTTLLVTAQTSNSLTIVNAQETTEEQKITTWKYENSEIVDNTMTFKDQTYTKDEIISKLPSSIIINEEQTVAITWDCNNYPTKATDEGNYTFIATLEEGYTIDEEIKIIVQLEKSTTQTPVKETQEIEPLTSNSKTITQKMVGEESAIAIDETSFPDQAFREFVSQYDRDNNGSLSDNEINRVTKMSVSNNKEIYSVKGIEYFTALQDLICSNTGITEIDISKNIKLKSLWLAPSQIDKLDVSKNTLLEELYVSNTNIIELDLSQNKNLVELNCNHTALTQLDVSHNHSLKKLNFSYTNIEEIDTSNNTVLEELNCCDTKITKINISQNQNLQSFNCYNTKISELDFTKNKQLQTLNCCYTKITNLDVSQNLKLTSLKCYCTPIKELNITQNGELKYLECSTTYLSSLDVSQNANLVRLECSSTYITTLDLKNNEKLQVLRCNWTDITSLDVSSNKELTLLECLFKPNQYSPEGLLRLDIGNNTNLTVNRSDTVRDYILATGKFNLSEACPGIDFSKVSDFNVKKSDGSIDSYDNYTAIDCVAGDIITYKYACGTRKENYNEVLDVTLKIVNKGKTTIRPIRNFNKVYDKNPVNLTKDDFIIEGSQGNVSFTYYDNQWKKLQSQPVNAGDYQAIIRVESAGDYSGESVSVTFTISPKPISITWDNNDLIYNGQTQAPKATANDLIAGDTCEILTSSDKKDVGTGYTATAESGNSNYVINDDCKTTTFAISPKPVDITWGNTDLTYTGQPQKPTATIKDSDLISGDTCNISVTGEQTNVKENYTATAESGNSNYVINDACKTTTFNIVKAQLTIDDLTAISRQYDGTNDVTLTGGTLIGIIDNEDVAIVMPTSGTIDSADVGKYDVSIVQPELQGTDKENYDLVLPNITANISPLPVQLSWSEDSLIYTGSQQVITATVDNIIGNDVINLTYSNNQATNVGNYSAEVTRLDNNNYTLDSATNITKDWSIQYYDTDAVATLSGEKKNNDSHWYTGEVTIIAPERYEISGDGSSWKNSLTSYSTDGHIIAGYSLKEKSTGYITEQKIIEFYIDTLAPTGEIEVKQNIFTQFLTDITFGCFFKDNATVTITGLDDNSGIAKIEYQKVTKGSNYDVNG